MTDITGKSKDTEMGVLHAWVQHPLGFTTILNRRKSQAFWHPESQSLKKMKTAFPEQQKNYSYQKFDLSGGKQLMLKMHNIYLISSNLIS